MKLEINCVYILLRLSWTVCRWADKDSLVNFLPCSNALDKRLGPSFKFCFFHLFLWSKVLLKCEQKGQSWAQKQWRTCCKEAICPSGPEVKLKVLYLNVWCSFCTGNWIKILLLLQAGLWFRTARTAVLILEEYGINIKKDLEMLPRVEGRTTVIHQVKHQA